MTKKYCFTICYSEHGSDDFLICKYFYYNTLPELNEFLSHHLKYFNYDLTRTVKYVRVTKNFME